MNSEHGQHARDVFAAGPPVHPSAETMARLQKIVDQYRLRLRAADRAAAIGRDGRRNPEVRKACEQFVAGKIELRELTETMNLNGLHGWLHR